jgi:hypothetical protein
VKFCLLLGKTAAETVTMLKEAFKDEAVGETQVQEWFNCFKRGEMSVEDQPCCGHPSTSRMEENVEKVHQAVLADRHRSSEKISEIAGVSRSSCQCTLTEDLMMLRVAAKFVPCLLKEEQKSSV